MGSYFIGTSAFDAAADCIIIWPRLFSSGADATDIL